MRIIFAMFAASLVFSSVDAGLAQDKKGVTEPGDRAAASSAIKKGDSKPTKPNLFGPSKAELIAQPIPRQQENMNFISSQSGEQWRVHPLTIGNLSANRMQGSTQTSGSGGETRNLTLSIVNPSSRKAALIHVQCGDDVKLDLDNAEIQVEKNGHRLIAVSPVETSGLAFCSVNSDTPIMVAAFAEEITRVDFAPDQTAVQRATIVWPAFRLDDMAD